jgi:rubredoxin-NAD+ reductase
LATRLATALTQAGVHWQLNTTIEAVTSLGFHRSIRYGPGSHELRVDAIVSAAGLQPNSEIAELAGLERLPAVPVDPGMATARPHIHAIGDVAQPPGAWRPFVDGARQGARVLAARLTGDDSASFNGAPKPITVKTPSFPMKLLPPDSSIVGRWQIEIDHPDAFVGYYLDVDERLQGYALGGDATRSHRASPFLGERLTGVPFDA